MKRSLLGLSVALVAGCSTAAQDIAPVYASPAPYQDYSCAQLASETARLDSRIAALGQRLDEAARNDRGITVVAALFFFPALLALGGTTEEEKEYARLEGERAAMQRTAAAKGCIAAAQAATGDF